MVRGAGVPRVLFVVFSLILVLPPTCRGQIARATEPGESRPGGWGLELGMARQGVSDELASPLRYRGTGFHGGLFLRGGGGDSVWELELLTEIARTESRIVRPDGGWEDLYRGTLRFTYLRPVPWLRDHGARLYLGGRLGGVAQYRYHQYWPGHSERFGDAVVPLELAGRWDWPLGTDARLDHTISAPLVSLVFRTPYTTLKYAPELEVAGPAAARGFSSRLRLSYRVSPGVALAAYHRISVFHYPDPFPVSWVGHGMGVELELLR